MCLQQKKRNIHIFLVVMFVSLSSFLVSTISCGEHLAQFWLSTVWCWVDSVQLIYGRLKTVIGDL